ncbi:MAG: NAD(P)/FAD-dependent oxidoreductase [Ignavibacteriae bacterium]|nr:NAD(P)/FAD-dependent oxidoreductase [Ignavibacteriota bacterium]
MLITNYNTIIIGGCAAGLFCAIEAGKRGTVLVIEHAEQCGKKILISGGGRCNFTNINTKPENFISQNPHFCKSALARFTPSDFLQLVNKHGIAYHEKKLGQLFCDGSSRQILKMLLDECATVNAQILLSCKVSKVSKDSEFIIETNQGTFHSNSLVIATGGLSIPKMGATDFGLQVAKKFSIPIIPPLPALVPLTFSHKEKILFEPLAGVSVDTITTANEMSFRENILFTHRGLSGPAILQASSNHSIGQPLEINLLPETDIDIELQKHRSSTAEVKNFLGNYLPKRLAEVWCDRLKISKQVSQLTRTERELFAQEIHSWKWTPSGTEGFEKAEVTTGGVDTSALSSKTMETNAVKGLYFIGEVVDVTGWLGGYNFQWAWASGAAAGRSVESV